MVAQTLQPNGCNGNNIREEEGGVGEADDSVQRDVGAEIEGRDEERHDQDYDERIDGDIPTRPYLNTQGD